MSCRLLLLSLLLAAPSFLAAAPVITFEGQTIVVTHTPGATIEWRYDTAYGQGAGGGTNRDPEADGITRIDMKATTGNEVTVVVAEIDTGAFAVAGRGQSPAANPLPSYSILPGPTGDYTWFVHSMGDRGPLVAWIRPGVGSWPISGRDADGTGDGIQLVQASEFSSHPWSGNPPPSFQPGDVIIGVNNLEAMAGTVDANLALPPSGGQFSFAIHVSPEVGEGGTKTIAVRRTGGSSGTVSVRCRTDGGSAVPGTDYEPVDTVLELGPGELVKTIQLRAIEDALYAPDSAVQIQLSEPAGATIGDGSYRLVIRQNDPLPIMALDALPESIQELDAPWTYHLPVKVTGGTRVPATVQYSGEVNYVNFSGELTFAPGETGKTIDLTIPGDTIPNAKGEIRIHLRNARDARLTVAGGEIPIVNDDYPTLVVRDVEVRENWSSAFVSLQVSPDYIGGRKVRWRTVDGTAKAGSDYVAESGVLEWYGFHLDVALINNSDPEPAETFYVEFYDEQELLVPVRRMAITIIDDETSPQPVIYIDDATVTEGTGGTTNAMVRIYSSIPAPQPITVVGFPLPGTATSELDYAQQSVYGTIPAGKSEVFLPIPIVPDAIEEPTETFRVGLGTVDGSLEKGNGPATVTILDDDGAPVPVVSVLDTTVREGTGTDSVAAFQVKLSAPARPGSRVTYATSNGSATSGADFESTAGDLVFTAGQTTATISVSVHGDAIEEFDESFSLTLSAPVEMTLGESTAAAVILDDDGVPLPGVSIADVKVTEGTGGTKTATFRVALTGAPQDGAFVDFVTVDGTAKSGSDYLSASGTLSFSGTDMVREISVTIVGDGTAEQTESFEVRLFSAVNVAIADGVGVGTIEDDDQPDSPPPTPPPPPRRRSVRH